MGIESTTTTLHVLNAGTGTELVVPSMVLMSLVSLPAIERLGGVVPGGDFERREGIKLAYTTLHRLTPDREGRLKHIRCLENGEQIL